MHEQDLEELILQERLSQQIEYTLEDVGFDTSVNPPLWKDLTKEEFLQICLRWKIHPGIQLRWQSVGLSDEIEEFLPKLSTPEMVRDAYIGNNAPLSYMVLGHIFPPPFAKREESPVRKTPMWGSDKVNFVQTRSDFLYDLIMANLRPQLERILGWNKGADHVETALVFERELEKEVQKRWEEFLKGELEQRSENPE